MSSSPATPQAEQHENFYRLLFEKKLSEVKQQVEAKKDKKHLDLLLVPSDHIEVVRQQKPLPEGLAVVPATEDDANAPIHIKEMFASFKSPKVLVNHKYKKYEKVKYDDEKFSKQKYEVDMEARKKKDADDLTEADAELKVDNSLLQPSSSAALTAMDKRMEHKMFKLYDMTSAGTEFDWQNGTEATICKRVKTEQKMSLKSNEPLLIEVLKFETKLGSKFGEFEPLFLDMALYDLNEKKKISETFHVDVNTDELLNGVPLSAKRDPVNQIRKALFHISERSQHIFLYIKISKVMHGEDDTVLAPYYNAEKTKEADVKKLKTAAATFSTRIGQHRQCVAWTAIPMFDNDDRVPPELNQPCSIFYRGKGNMSDAAFFQVFSNQTQMKKLKSFNATITLKVTDVNDFQPKYVEKGIISMKHPEQDEAPPILVKDIYEFSLNPSLTPHERLFNVLFINPETVNVTARQFSSSTSRNISIRVQVKDNDNNLGDEGLPLIFGKSSEPYMVTNGYTHVTYHNRTPEYNDEWKIRLPTVITPNHHLLFTFSHVVCKEKSGKPSEVPLAWAFLPLIESKSLINGKKSMRLIQEFPKPQQYLSDESQKNAKYIDVGKNLPFNIAITAVSTIYSEEPKLSQFFEVLPLVLKKTKSEFNPEDMICKSTEGLLQIKPAIAIIQYMPVIFNQLLKTICSTDYKKASAVAFRVLLSSVNNVRMESKSDNSQERAPLLTNYIDEYFDNFTDFESPVFHELTKQWCSWLEDLQKTRKPSDKANDSGDARLPFQYSWFLFDLIYKSAILFLDKKKMMDSERMTRFTSDFQDLISRLVDAMAAETIYLSVVGLNVAKTLNQNLALFMRDLFNIMDRGFLINLIDRYMKRFTTDHRNFEVLQELRITFLSIVVDYEHFVQLCIPSEIKIDNKETIDATDLCHSEYMSGLVIEHCKSDLTNRERTVRGRTLNLIRYILTKHDYDARYQDREALQRFAGLFFPFAVHFLDIFDDFKKVAEEKMRSEMANEAKTKKELEEKNNDITSEELSDDKKTKTAADELEKKKEELTKLKKKHEDLLKQVDEETKRVKLEEQSAIICFMFVVKNLRRDVLKTWLKKDIGKMQKFLQLLQLAMELFQYSSKEDITERSKVGIETSTTQSLSDAKSQLENMYNSLDARPRNLRDAKKKSTIGRSYMRPSLGSVSMTGTLGKKDANTLKGDSKEIIDKIVLWEANLATEVSLAVLNIVFDCTMTFDQVFKQHAETFDWFFNILVRFLQTRQSEKTLHCVFIAMNNIIMQYKSIIFGKNTPYSEQLCYLLLNFCYCKIESIRALAVAVCYSLLRTNYELLGNFTRTKIQTTVALSKLVDNLNDKNLILLKGSFKTIAKYAAADKIAKPTTLAAEKPKTATTVTTRVRSTSVMAKNTPFDAMKKEESESFNVQVQSLIDRLGKALEDTVAIKELEKKTTDGELIGELYMRIATGYRHAPELCVSWYDNLAKFHLSRKERQIEAAQCMLYIVGLVYQYFKLTGNVKGMNYEHIVNVAPALQKESWAEIKALFAESDETPVFQSHYFTDTGFVALVEDIVQLCVTSNYFEYAVELNKLLIEYYEHTKDYAKLQEKYSATANLFGELARVANKASRLFGSYYRVAFYGQRFSDELRDKQFVYKLPKIARLADMVDYFNSVFAPLYGAESIKTVGDSFQPTDKIRAENMAFIQITSLKSFFRNNRTTHFEQSTNIEEFTFETPFTKSGKPHGDVTEQCKRKTILKVGIAFPCTTTRVSIVSKEETVLSPVEFNMETIETSLYRIQLETLREPVNINNLQMVLSGTVIPQVNEGIPQIVKGFLGCATPEQTWGKEPIQKMKNTCKEFLTIAYKGIIIANKYASAEQKKLQLQFVKGFDVLENLFRPLITDLPDFNKEELLKELKDVTTPV